MLCIRKFSLMLLGTISLSFSSQIGNKLFFPYNVALKQDVPFDPQTCFLAFLVLFE